MKVLSLFDGMSCGQIALNRAGFEVTQYFASEVDQHAIKVTQANYPNTVQLGDVNNWRAWNVPWHEIDLLIGGSPCQGFSFAGNQRAFNDPRSKLFFTYVEILAHIRAQNPNVKFLLENVKMKKEFMNIMSFFMGVEPIHINSNLVSAQNRSRYYWTNIEGIEQPADRGILLRDIVHEHADLLDVPTFNVHPSGRGMNGIVYSASNDKSKTLTTNKGEGQKVAFALAEYIVPFDQTLKILDKEVQRGKVGYFRKDSQANCVYYLHDKAVTLCGDSGGGAAKMGQYLFGDLLKVAQFGEGRQGERVYSINGKSTSISASGGGKGGNGGMYLFGCISPDRVNKRQNDQRFNDGRKFYTLTTQDRHGVLIEGYIRKLTPIECERLQTVPDNYTNHVSNTQRYKMLGNGWTVEAIAHMFSYLKPRQQANQ